ncbi:MAG: bifunctional UDP-sugar hydrolase/5'-nucleotidase [Polyangiales bacterium]
MKFSPTAPEFFRRSLSTAVLLGSFGSISVVACSGDDTSPVIQADSGGDAGGESASEAGQETTDTFDGLDATETSETTETTAGPTADIQVLSISDWHGQVDPINDRDPMGSGNYGGIGGLSTYFKEERAKNPNTLVVTAGDAIGATPALSNFFDDKPAIEGLNFLQLTADTFGNHDFDRTIAVLKQRMDEAKFTFVSTNMTNVAAELGTKVITPFAITEVGSGANKVKVAFLGITNPDAPSLQFPGRFGTITISEPAVAANKAAVNARAAGAQVVIALAHLGASAVDATTKKPTGPLLELGKSLVGIDRLVGDHTDIIVNEKAGTTLTVENRSKGRTYARMGISVVNGVVKSVDAKIIDPILNYSANLTCATPPCTCPTTACPDASYTCAAGKCNKSFKDPDAAAEAVLKPYRDKLSVKFDEKLGIINSEFKNDTSRLAESPIGDLIADSMLDKYKALGAQIAITNSGGIRTPLPSSYAPKDLTLRRTAPGYAAGPPYDLVVGDAYSVLPFGNQCVVRKISGKTLWAVLDASVAKLPAADGRFLQIAGFSFKFSISAAPLSRVTTVTLDGGKVIAKDDATEYTMVTNNFTSAGGDGYAMLVESTPSPAREVMADVLLDYIKAKSPLTATAATRILPLP